MTKKFKPTKKNFVKQVDYEYKQLKDRPRKTFQHKLHFSPKYRQDLKKSFLRLKDSIEASWDLDDDQLREQHLDREILTNLGKTTADYLSFFKEIDDWNHKRKIKNKHFYLYKHNKTKKILIEFKFTRSNTGKNCIETWVIPQGFPTKKINVKAIRYKKSLKKIDYRLIYQGSHFQTIYSLRKGRYILKSRKLNKTLYVLAISEKQYKLSLSKY